MTVENIREIQLFYEISISIGQSLDLNKMLRESLSVILRKLNCSGGGVHFYETEKNKYVYKDVFSTPRNISKNIAYIEALKMLPREMALKQKSEFISELPLLGESDYGFYVIMELPDVGFLVLLRNNAQLSDEIVKSLKLPLSKLAVSCISCKQNMELSLSRERLEKGVKERTLELLRSNEQLKQEIEERKRIEGERLRMEVELRESKKMESVGTLAAGVAHEINTPMQYITDNTAFLKKFIDMVDPILRKIEEFDFEDDNDRSMELFWDVRNLFNENKVAFMREEAIDAINDSLEGIKQVRNIILAMKEFAHPGTKAKSISDINKALENILTISRNVWKYTAKLELELDHTLPEINCNIDELNQVFLNMIVNATDALEEKYGKSMEGRIFVRTKNSNDSVIIEFEDNGSGIPAEIIDKIYDPFFTTKEVGKGSGQGLAISYDIIVNKHKGFIDVESSEKGTLFKIALPLKI